MSDPEPFGEDEDGDPLFWTCPNPDCSTQKTSPEKAAAHCRGEDGDSGDANPGVEAGSSVSRDGGEWRACFADAMRYFNQQVDQRIHDHTEDGEHPDRADTAREYYNDRGWTDETIDEYLLGYAPADRELLDHLRAKGYERETILATGLFTEFDDGSLSQLWAGRYVLPYFDVDGEPVYAISRATGAIGGGEAGYDGHPRDFISGKYGKLAHSKEYVEADEPIFGLDSVEDGEPLLVAGGIADAITLQQAGYACISPVTTVRFKGDHEERVVDLVEEHHVPTVYIVNDNERPTIDERETDGDVESITDALTIEQYGEGLRGAFGDADFLLDAGIDTRLVTLPRAGRSLRKVDPDDFIHEEWGEIDTLLAAAKPAEQHVGYDRGERSIETAASHTELPLGATSTSIERDVSSRENARVRSEASAGDHSALFDLDIRDVTGRSWGSRGVNPLGHHGNSENYYVLVEQHGVGYDHKYRAAYNALTHLLVEAGERRAERPNGRLDDSEILAAWQQAKEERLIPDDDPIPHRALRHLAFDRGLCKPDDAEGGWKLPTPAYNGALTAVEDEYGLNPGREPIDGSTFNSGQQHAPETCSPPGLSREGFESEQRWDDLQGDRYEEWLDRNRPTLIWGDDAGSGKTTNAALGAAARERPHTVLFDKHEKAREFINDDVTPDGYFHLKGGEQPSEPCCMDAAVRAPEGETPECEAHGHPSDWPRMNPIYERPRDDELRERYEALASGVGPRRALVILDDDGDLLDENAWIDQFDGLENEDRVVGVHEYQTLKTAVGDRDPILDETPRLLADEQRVGVDGLVRAKNRLDEISKFQPRDDPVGHNLNELGKFAGEVVDAIVSDDSGEDALAEIDAPELLWDAYETVGDVAGNYVETVQPSEPWHYAEALAQAKITYNEGLVTRIRKGDWNGEPFCIDSLLAAATKAGLDGEQTRRAIAVPSTLEACPWCGGEVASDNGARVCTDDGCSWHEADNTVTQKDSEPARALAWLDADTEELEPGQSAGLVSKVLPPASDLPKPLDLDATATPSKVAAFYGEESVDVTGDEPLDLDGKLNVTQVLNGQYHAQTIKDSPSLRDRIQSVIDTAGEVHEKPLFGIRGDLIPLFKFPENGEVLKYHAARGLNRSDCDAVVCIGAPHPNVEDLTRDGELLAMDRPDLRVGGKEHSTRRDAPNPPVYRKLLYEDEHGDGRAVPTKHYTGLVGDLFRESREKELEQFVHRIRPLLVDDAEPAKNAYLLTNVPTDVPVDDVVEFDELAGDLSAVFPVTEGAIRLLGYGRDVLAGDGPDGFRGGSRLVEEQDDGTIANKVKGWHRLAQVNGEDVTQRTVRNWVDELESVGLLTPEKYEERRGVSYTADIATSKRALQVLSCNGGFEVAAMRRLAAKLRESAGSLEWLGWAESVFDLSGDRCGWDRPPSPTR